MEEGSWGTVVLRALITGVTMGVLAGVLVAVDLVIDLPGGLSASGVLMMAIIGGIIGALIGFACAIPAGLILAAGRRFLERHVPLARVCGGVLGGILLASFTAAGYGLTLSGPANDGGLIMLAFVLGAAVGVLNTSFVVTGEQCLVAKCLTRRVR